MLPAWVYSVLLLGSVLGSPLSDTQNSTRDHVAHPYPVIPEANSSSTTGLAYSGGDRNQGSCCLHWIMWHIHIQSSQKPTLPALRFTVRACPVVPLKTTLTMILHKMLHQTPLEKGCLLFCRAQECWLCHTAAFYLHVLCITCQRSYRPETRQLEIPMTLMG